MSAFARILGVLMIACGSLLALPLGSASAATINIAVAGTIGQYWFCNSSYQNGICPTTVNVGDTVQWNFNGDFYSAHSTRHCSDGCDGTPSGTPLWDAPIAAVQTYSYTFTTPGSYPYQCEVHPLDMQGVVTVVAGGVGGETQLADAGLSIVRHSPRDSFRNVWFGMAGIAGGMIVLTAAAWCARRLAVEEPPS